MKDIILFLESSLTSNGALYFECARRLGLTPILVSKRPSQHRHVAHYQSIKLRRTTLEEVSAAIDQLGRDRVAGVYSPLSQRAELVARIAHAAGLPHSDPEAVSVCSDKYLTRRVLADAGMKDVGFELVRSGNEGAQACERLGGPVIVKPRVSSGATGVRICHSPDEVRDFVDSLANSMPVAHAHGVVVEEFIDGPQFGVEMFDGKAIAVRRKHIGPPPASIPIGMDLPPLEGAEVCAAIAAHAERATEAAGYRRGAAHVEVRYASSGPRLIEINPRIVGGLGAESVHRAYGIDLIEACIRFACGMPYDVSRRKNRASATRYILRDGSAVRSILGREDALEIPGVADIGFSPQWFARSGPARNYEDRIGYVISEADTSEHAIRSAEEGLRRLRIVPESGWRSAVRNVTQQLVRSH